jgi:hypothetical protein
MLVKVLITYNFQISGLNLAINLRFYSTSCILPL